ncbi:MAG: glycoside hydrolase family 92 protein [Planctomycetes bacterium]|nr:glycoside hydrolase family 92 protein [Planctomycetota bacterium]
MTRRFSTTAALAAALLFSNLAPAGEAPAGGPGGEVAGAVDRLAEVNPFIGTGGAGFGCGGLYPGAQVPFGMARVSPDTGLAKGRLRGRNFGGYHFQDTHVRAFSHTHCAGAGVMDMGNVGLMPALTIEPPAARKYGVPFTHEGETAAPGYYAVTLPGPGVRVELTATARCGAHRYTFPPDQPAYLLIDASAALATGACARAEVEVAEGGREVRGLILNKGEFSRGYGGCTVYFVVRARAEPTAHGVWEGEAPRPGGVAASGTSVGAWFTFAPRGGEPLEARVGISFVSVEQAAKNLEADGADRSFDDLRAAAASAWERALSVVSVTGGTPSQRRVFTTALYHVMQSPTNFTEAGGVYRGIDQREHEAKGFLYHTDFSLWDTFRTLHPLMVLLAPDRARDYVRSLLAMEEQGGFLPRWPQATGESGSMIGTHAVVVFADTWLKGVRDFDAERALAASIRAATVPGQRSGRGAVEHYLTKGYVPADAARDGCSHTLEYAYDDFAIANLAAALGRNDVAERFRSMAKNYRNVWDPETRFFRSRKADGSWVLPLRPTNVFDNQYVEGDAWHWRWFAPHDAPGLIALFGGPEPFVQELRAFFSQAAAAPDTAFPDKYYWHGNEPDIHAAYLFNEAGRPDLTQQCARWVMHKKYRDAPDGLDGNDDYGTLSAWHLFSALGFYPVPGSTRYLVGSPIFERALLRRAAGDLEIIARGAGPTALYVQSAALNGKPLDKPWFDHADIAAGGRLEFQMGTAPSAWGR